MRHNMLSLAITAGLGVAGLLAAGQAHAQSAGATSTELQELRAQIAALQSQIDALQERSDAQSDINVANAEAAEASKKAEEKVDKLAKVVNDTQISGKVFLDMTNIDQENHGVATNASGTGFDVKRFYIGINHKFDDTWSANLTTDFQYVSSLDSAADVYVKKAYLQGKFSDAFVLRAGSADMPWIPFAENYYGFRYVENTVADRLKFGTSADWGLHAGGDLAGKKFSYAVSVVNGAGYKNPSRSKGMDVEGRIAFVPVEGFVIAAGGYSGTLGKETETTDALHTATRGDLMVAYAKDSTRFGVEYFRAKNWATVTSPLADDADGYSVWGSYGFGTSGFTGFARYDRADLSNDLDPQLTEKYFNVGVEYLIRKGIKVAAVYKDTDRSNNGTIDLQTREFGLWGEVAF